MSTLKHTLVYFPINVQRPRANPARLQAPSFVGVLKQKFPYEARQTIESLECLGGKIELEN